jgi:zinc protease
MFARLSLALVALLCLTRTALAETVTTFTLDNGLEVVVIEDHRAPVVVQMVWYKASAPPTNRPASPASRIFWNT